MDNDVVTFEGRSWVFRTVSTCRSAPSWVFCPENGQGMVFDIESPMGDEDDIEQDDDTAAPGQRATASKRPAKSEGVK